MSCTNCFNGCTEITSDKCVRYTGADIPALGIQNGDTLQFVEQTLAQFLITTLNGTGIKPIVDLQGVCSIVANNIPVCVGCTGPTLNDLLQALIDSACDLQDLISGVVGNIETLEGPYNEGCLTVVDTTFSNTHNVLQAVITKLCALDVSLTNTINSLNNYVLESELANLVVTILEDEGLVGPVTKEYTKMVPYVAYPWFAPISVVTGNFDSTGAGLVAGPYEKVNFCNGQNFTPDMRGRVPAGVTNGMLGGAMDPEVDPLLPGNPTYGANPFSKHGTNSITLQKSEMPVHTHANTIQFNDPGHNHANAPGNAILSDGLPNFLSGYTSNGSTVFNTTGITVGITNVPEGESRAHSNTQPTIGCYYIMYIP
jgi:microcystin-dependent protein